MRTLQDNPQFKAFASSISYGIIVGDANGNIVDFNEAALQMFGYEGDALRGLPISTIMPKRYRQAHVDGMNRFNRTQQTTLSGNTVRVFGQHRSGKEFPVELHLSQWKNEKDEQFFTGSLRQYSALENNLSWILASSAAATVTLVGVLVYLVTTL